MDRERLAWAAGFLDGEGYFASNREMKKLVSGPKLYLTPHIGATQTAKYGGVPDVLEKLVSVFNGSKIDGPYQNKGKPNWTERYNWRLYGVERVQFAICCLWPWLGSQKKRDIITMMNDYWQYRKDRRVANELDEARLLDDRDST